MSTDSQHTCPSCGNEFPGAMEYCPICMLRKALAGSIESVESSTEDTVKPPPALVAHRFEHYELMTGEDGKPVELGHGAMGVTYKALDVDLRCPVTLKVISERYLGDEIGAASFSTRSPSGGQRAPSECCLGPPLRQSRRELLLRDGVCRGRNSGASG
jgi:hypothetical protein